MKMIALDLKIGFTSNEDVMEFMRFLQYLEWCGNVGHSTGVTVNADGDGTFKMACLVCDPKDNTYKPINDLITPLTDTDVEAMKRSQKEWQDELQIPLDKRDRNELSFCFGD